MKVETEVIGEDKVLLNLAEMQERALDARPATRKVRELFVASDKKNFESEGAYIGKSWAPLAEATLARKKREGIDPRPLHGKTGDLGTAVGGGRGKRTGATKATARAGVGVWYSVFTRGSKGSVDSHNTGEPARMIVGLKTSEYDDVLTIVADWVVKGIAP